jgi:hypothetical protein
MKPGLLLRSIVCPVCIAACLAGAACAGQPLTKETSMSSDDEEQVTRKVSRVGRPSPSPISFEGKRYEQIVNGTLLGLGQRTGLLAVTDEASNQRIGVVKIYDYPRREGLEADAGDVFFVSAQLDAPKREIVIESERRERFAYRIDDGTVHKLP